MPPFRSAASSWPKSNRCSGSAIVIRPLTKNIVRAFTIFSRHAYDALPTATQALPSGPDKERLGIRADRQDAQLVVASGEACPHNLNV